MGVTYDKAWTALLVRGETNMMTFVNGDQFTNISYEGVIYGFRVGII